MDSTAGSLKLLNFGLVHHFASNKCFLLAIVNVYIFTILFDFCCFYLS
uniref:ATP synthase subunit 8 n=1 Tax=Tetraleurodes acaciae TaxID=267835 RepID=Q674P8_TETAA|nr:ATP synthase F0 subunit 8 [Tetraleurodes acaciae]AAU14151.1 ATP synthase subunit 8 [Tetraleurodes acaciae]